MTILPVRGTRKINRKKSWAKQNSAMKIMLHKMDFIIDGRREKNNGCCNIPVNENWLGAFLGLHQNLIHVRDRLHLLGWGSWHLLSMFIQVSAGISLPAVPATRREPNVENRHRGTSVGCNLVSLIELWVKNVRIGAQNRHLYPRPRRVQCNNTKYERNK